MFGMRRKQIGNVLRSITGLSAEDAIALLDAQGIDPKSRPEVLSPEQMVALMRAQD
jgi:16S rRNA A1518/A1519 N6-dimethyltransferase RsmA/KsgA/DIM1 with predicted DNA glycosylase/AP lyase activity